MCFRFFGVNSLNLSPDPLPCKLVALPAEQERFVSMPKCGRGAERRGRVSRHNARSTTKKRTLRGADVKHDPGILGINHRTHTSRE